MTPPLTRFVPDVTDRAVADLHARLDLTRWPDQLADTTWEHGVDGAELRALVEHWRHGFDVRAALQALDADLPGWMCRIGAHDLHVARVPAASGTPARRAVVLLHGWPSSYAEWRTVAARLAAQGHEVIVPSLPGHGFSSRPTHVGMGSDAAAPVLLDLLAALGFDVQARGDDTQRDGRVVVHGGDRGAFVGTSMAALAPDRLAGLHVSLPGGIAGEGGARTADETAWLTDTAAWAVEEGGYSAIQSTRPQTLAYAMHDSPVGMLAWIVEKHRVWSDCDGRLANCFTPDQLLLNASIYWFSETFRSASHWYWEHRVRPPVMMRPGATIDVPTGVIRYPKEVMRAPRSAVARKYRLVHWTERARGGHFPAYEDPEALAADIAAFAAALD